MFSKVEDFLKAYRGEVKATVKIMEALTDDSLNMPQHDIIRSLGRVSWHIVTTIPDMCGQCGVPITGPDAKDAIPATAARIKEEYLRCSEQLVENVSNWSDADLQKEDNMYGETWKRGYSLYVFINHEVHHRGQMTVMMRMAGMKVPGVYGPAQEEWEQYGMPAPTL